MTGGGPRYTSSVWRWIKDSPGQAPEPPSPKALADRARREAMAEGRDLTGRMMGDPPAGRSALDRMREREARRLGAIGQGQTETGDGNEEQGDD